MLITHALAGHRRLRLTIISLCAGIAGATTFGLAIGGEDDIICVLAGWAAGLLAFAVPAVLLEWFWRTSRTRSVPAESHPVLTK